MKTIALFFGGLSNEAEVSIMSAQNVVKYFDYRRYKLILIYWRKEDRRFYIIKNLSNLRVSSKNRLAVEDFSKYFDIALLMTHGRYGEDGVLQAVLESQNVKYCGGRVLGSAVCMDKVLCKNLITAAGWRQAKYSVLDFRAASETELKKEKQKINQTFNYPLYIKPANSGSSVGISKIEKPSQFLSAIKEALKHDTKILVEEGFVHPREIEVAVLGNEELIISHPGELRLVKDFYDYKDKYKNGETQLIIPAQVTVAQAKEIKFLAEKVYRLTGSQGFARIDFFIAKNKVYINEINTLPGFTDISMFPMLMMNEGMSYKELLNKIIALAY
ncbi:D-alanine--D-alanine ligase [Candidatus Falkowbacteria bacterium]|uniref:D-alanine--D-alanine ligase n=1 Tax=Candidatus Falkowbacteria bacterium CG10_big_fil_rev_8_21_14_0_10_37_18 TaxID=1974562 RepID=A0A2H0V8B6_9BACT|nr:D-alanine--D-alanine ligase [Candidatus Falkowbacteria bacterium]NCQ12986.1 D-alanine--D-alanine ligase [Candidatus Falkowbacteria bacterium]PIR95354.1 MAG: D-alanine--D-alanine ligase A [Candidatus Falkowbacteria bacterium CG10_big_fil_rev_8_21_14_0_10_37_18]